MKTRQPGLWMGKTKKKNPKNNDDKSPETGIFFKFLLTFKIVLVSPYETNILIRIVTITNYSIVKEV